MQEGIVPGGGVALLDVSEKISSVNTGSEVLAEALKAPFITILGNAGLDPQTSVGEGLGVNVITGETVDMIGVGIIDPVLVTKSALKNAVSVALTVMSADCVISNVRADESN